MGNPVLRRHADPIDDPADPVVVQLVQDMLETLSDAGGVGLAASQVHVSKRLVIFYVPESRTEDGRGIPLTVLINPEIIPLGDEMADGTEACLSIPGLVGTVPRWRRILYRAVGLDGQPVEREAEGYHARVVQHECDHLEGVLYPSRMVDLSTFGFVEEFKKTE